MNQYLWSKKTFAFSVRVPNSQETTKREVERHLKIRFGLFVCEPSLPICIKTNKTTTKNVQQLIQTAWCCSYNITKPTLGGACRKPWYVMTSLSWKDNCVSTAGRLIVSSTPTVSSASFCAANHGVHPEYTGSLKTALWEYHVKHVCPFWEYILMCTFLSHAQDLQYTHADKKEELHQSIVLQLSCDVSVYWYRCTALQLAHIFTNRLHHIFLYTPNLSTFKCPHKRRIPLPEDTACWSKSEPHLFCFFFLKFLLRGGITIKSYLNVMDLNLHYSLCLNILFPTITYKASYPSISNPATDKIKDNILLPIILA